MTGKLYALQCSNILCARLLLYELCPDRVRSLYFNKKYYEMVGYTKEQYEQYADSVTSTLYGDSAEIIFEKPDVR